MPLVGYSGGLVTPRVLAADPYSLEPDLAARRLYLTDPLSSPWMLKSNTPVPAHTCTRALTLYQPTNLQLPNT
jgi:hypothetical protein